MIGKSKKKCLTFEMISQAILIVLVSTDYIPQISFPRISEVHTLLLYYDIMNNPPPVTVAFKCIAF